MLSLRLSPTKLLLLIPLVLIFALPQQGSSTPITQTETFTNDVFGTKLAEVTVTVYEPGDTFQEEVLSEYVYHYSIFNDDQIDFMEVYLRTFKLDLNKAAPISDIVAPSHVNAFYDELDDDIFFLDLGIEEGATLAFYVVSPAAKELVTASLASNAGAASAQLWAPDPIPVPVVPEPATLLLVGTGLIALAGFRRKSAK